MEAGEQIKYLAYILMVMGAGGESCLSEQELEDALDAQRIFDQITRTYHNWADTRIELAPTDLPSFMMPLYVRHKAYKHAIEMLLRAEDNVGGAENDKIREHHQDMAQRWSDTINEQAREMAKAAERILLDSSIVA